MKKYSFPLRAKSGRHFSGKNRDKQGGGWNTPPQALSLSKRPGQVGLKFLLREQGLESRALQRLFGKCLKDDSFKKIHSDPSESQERSTLAPFMSVITLLGPPLSFAINLRLGCLKGHIIKISRARYGPA